jgi:hypothetical protein
MELSTNKTDQARLRIAARVGAHAETGRSFAQIEAERSK